MSPWIGMVLTGAISFYLASSVRPDHDQTASHLTDADRSIAELIVAARYRRAIYTRMDSEIDLDMMYASIGEAIGALQQLAPQIRDHALQFTCNQLIAEASMQLREHEGKHDRESQTRTRKSDRSTNTN